MNNKDYNNEQYINSLVDEYKQTDSIESRDKLISSFYPYFKKYSNLIRSVHAVSLQNVDTMKFLRLFMSEEDRSSRESLRKSALKFISLFRKIFSDYTWQDLFDQMVMYFLEALEKYKPMIANHKRTKERISFTHYIQVSLRYKLKSLVSSKFYDALSFDNYIPFNELIYNANNRIEKDYVNIDLKWIHGITTGDIFKILTEAQRYILWIRYESDPEGKVLSTIDISKVTGFHHKTITYKLNQIRKILEKHL